MEIAFQFSGVLWEYPGEAPWVFVTLPEDDAEAIRAKIPHRAGFGSVKVTAVIAESEWSTSVFPDKTSGSYLLPIKRSIRNVERLSEGDVAHVSIRIELDQ